MTITVFNKNLITNQISTYPKRNNDFEIEIINNFTTKLSSTSFSEARTTAIEQMITKSGQTLDQETIHNLGRIKQTYFTGNPEVLNDVNFSTLFQNNDQSLNLQKNLSDSLTIFFQKRFCKNLKYNILRYIFYPNPKKFTIIKIFRLIWGDK